jgi:anti-sigma factor RsiW
MDEQRKEENMINTTKHNACKKIKTWLFESLANRIGPDAGWVQKHTAECPRCQRRLASVSKVHLALSMIKAQPHNLDLLMRANTKAVGVLRHSLRGQPKAQKLRTARPEPKLSQKCRKYARSAANAAACIAILFLAKVGILGSMSKFQSQGQGAMKQYYASHVGQDMSDDIFSA